ncbi:alpha-N-acetylglucosaminidase [Rhodanobacter sp. Col0626]|uniref:alpha-N-acetylglucosaminidase n=1 Tax=Rhodanobacter sp. Col0626 TaxID=3415679 RepID=UPI003CF9B4B2
MISSNRFSNDNQMRLTVNPIKYLAVTAWWGAAMSCALAQAPMHQGDPGEPTFDVGPARAALTRLVGSTYAAQVDLKAVSKIDQNDYFRITQHDRRVTIEATTPATLIAGFGGYLKEVAHANISLNGEQLNLPRTLPLPRQTIFHEASGIHRFAFNDVDEGYTQPYAHWDYWQHKIDVLALHGINEVLVYQGQDKVYEQTLQDFGYTQAELRKWIPQITHQPWWLLQNLCCSHEPIAQSTIDQEAVLASKMAGRLRELGMTAVFPGYYGTVPPGFNDRNPGARSVSTGKWDGFSRPDWLDPTHSTFAKVAADFYRRQAALFGDSHMFKMDPLHEGSEGAHTGGINLVAAVKDIQGALEKAHPGATWVLLGWEGNPLPEVIRGLDKSHSLIVDGSSESSPEAFDREAEWQGIPYTFGTIWNFGGHTNMGANLSTWHTRYWPWKARPNSAMTGIALMPEASDNNPVALDFFTELAWRKAPADLDQWFMDWAWRRYGGSRPDPHAVAAWHILQQTAYDLPANWDSKYQTGYYETAPSLSEPGASPLHYDPAKIQQALAQLLDVAPSLRHSSAYRYDLTDLTRQALSVRGRVLLPRIKAAFEAKDKAEFDSLSARWLQLMKQLDAVLGTNEQFMLGPWLAHAKSYTRSSADSAAVEYDARALITLWGNPQEADYARREWQGLLGDYYYSRWKAYFGSLDDALDKGRKPESIDWYAFGEKWAHERNTYPTQPKGDIHAIARHVLDDLTHTVQN